MGSKLFPKSEMHSTKHSYELLTFLYVVCVVPEAPRDTPILALRRTPHFWLTRADRQKAVSLTRVSQKCRVRLNASIGVSRGPSGSTQTT